MDSIKKAFTKTNLQKHLFSILIFENVMNENAILSNLHFKQNIVSYFVYFYSTTKTTKSVLNISQREKNKSVLKWLKTFQFNPLYRLHKWWTLVQHKQ